MKKGNRPDINKLEEIAEIHLNPTQNHILDKKVQFHSMHKLMPYMEGPEILELVVVMACGLIK